MSSFKRFFVTGLADADARWRQAIAPRSFVAVDRYLAGSAVVRGFDRVTRALRDWLATSVSGQTLNGVADSWKEESWQARYAALAAMLLTAAVCHVVLTAINGPRPGWFWLIVPGLVTLFSIVIFAGSRTGSRQ